MRYLSKEILEGLDIGFDEVVASMERLIAEQVEGRVWVAPKTNMEASNNRYMMATLAAADDPPYMAVKALLINPANPERGLNTINASITLLNSGTGEPVVTMDGNWVTAVRTAGASALVARRLANADSQILSMVGCGVQARSHLQAFSELFPIQEIRAFGRGVKNRDALCRAAVELGLKAVACESAKEAVTDADIVVSSIPLVPRPEPFLDAAWLKPGAFVSSTDLALPWKRETMPIFDRIIIDDRNQERAMTEPMVDAALVDGDVAELISGEVKGRFDKGDRTAFVFRSVAVGDLAIAALAYKKAG